MTRTWRGFQGDCFYGAAFNARVASQELGAGIWPLGREALGDTPVLALVPRGLVWREGRIVGNYLGRQERVDRDGAGREVTRHRSGGCARGIVLQ